MKHELLLLPYATEHKAELENMVLALYAEDSQGEDMSVAKIERTVDELTQHPEKGDIHVLQLGEEVVGYAIVVIFWSNDFGGDIGVIDELYVKPKWRCRGIGTRYIERLAGSTRLRGLSVEVTPANEPARSYYQRSGFVVAPNRHLFRKL